MKDPMTYPSGFEVWHLTPPSHWRRPRLMGMNGLLVGVVAIAVLVVRCRAAEVARSGGCGRRPVLMGLDGLPVDVVAVPVLIVRCRAVKLARRSGGCGIHLCACERNLMEAVVGGKKQRMKKVVLCIGSRTKTHAQRFPEGSKHSHALASPAQKIALHNKDFHAQRDSC